LLVQDFYEELWSALPAELDPPALQRRRAFLLREARPGIRLLDLGCGEGTFAALAAAAGAVVRGADVAASALARARASHPQLEFDHLDERGPLPYADNSFDVVWASEVIEHVADTARWLSEVRRVLVPRGRVLVTTPAHGRLWTLLWGVERFSAPLSDHLHLYTRRSLRVTLGDFGFGEITIAAAGRPPERMLLARGVR
jgi:ubiquinone/menaquinone biosynthesis C-methylase UbiE